jgi:hypothetical protein
MPQEVEEVFNPGEYTDRELLKLVYRDLHAFKEEFADYKKNNNYNKDIQRLDLEVLSLKGDITLQKTLRSEDNRRIQRWVAVAGVVVVILQIVLNLVIKP